MIRQCNNCSMWDEGKLFCKEHIMTTGPNQTCIEWGLKRSVADTPDGPVTGTVTDNIEVNLGGRCTAQCANAACSRENGEEIDSDVCPEYSKPNEDQDIEQVVTDLSAVADVDDLNAIIKKATDGLTLIGNFPIPEQDNMIALNMRLIARNALLSIEIDRLKDKKIRPNKERQVVGHGRPKREL